MPIWLDPPFEHQRIRTIVVRPIDLMDAYHLYCPYRLYLKNSGNKRNKIKIKEKEGEECLLEQSCEDAHFFLSSACSVEFCRLRIDRPHPAVIVPKREKARFTIGDDGTLFGRGDSISGT